MTTKLLVTGDYWHNDFKGLIAGGAVSSTMVTLDKFLHLVDLDLSATSPLSIARDDNFDLIVIAQSRQGQFDQSLIDAVKAFAGATPVVMMLGSWCEGELRSDQPAEGITRVFWHQWRGRFSAFLKHLDQHAVTDWHQTATATDADRIVTVETMPDSKAHENVCIGISAWNVESYDALSEAIQSFGWRTRWVERSNLHNIAGAINAICIDANSLDDNLERRICWLKEQVLDVPIVLSLNFPRANEVSKLRSIGVSSVVSKPFELNDLQLAIVQCLAPGSESTHSVPAPKGLSKPQNTVV